MSHRVLIFSTAYFPLVGGAEVAMKELTDRMPDIRFDLVCARLRPELTKMEQVGNVTVHRVGFGSTIDKILLPIVGPFVALRIEARSEERGASSSSRLAPRSSLLIWSLMASYGGMAALVYTWLRPTSKLLLTLQEGDPLERYEKHAGPFNWMRHALFRRANIVQAISHFLADWSVRMGFHGKPEVIPNGVDIKKFSRSISSSSLTDTATATREKIGLSDTDIILVTASRLSLKNAVDDLIRSLVDLPSQYKALIAGEGEDDEMLHALTKELKLESRVVFLGKKTHDELPAILQASDIFVRASLSEGLGNSFLEAMVAGIPIIGTPVGGIPDFLKDGETGMFCQPRDPVSIAKAARRIQEEPGLRERLIANGERLVRERYDWDVIAKKMRGLIEGLY